MALTRESMLARAAARDARYDGVFLTCVRTTGIYCLPSCKARAPLPQNVEHCATPDEARARGYRACRRCRPDDFHAGRDPVHERFVALLGELRSRPSDFADNAALARTLGVGGTRLAALFRQHRHTTAADALVAARVAFACDRLAGTRARVLDVGLDAGFASSSTFHDNFRRRTGLAPEAYRRMLGADRFALHLPERFPRREFLHLWGRDPSGTCERVVDGVVHKAVVLAGEPVVVSIALRSEVAECRVDGARGGPDVMRAAHGMVVRMLDLAGDPAPGIAVLRREPRLRPWLRLRPGLRLLPAASPWECLLWAILGQQVNLRFAIGMRAAAIARCGARVGDLVAHPDAAAVAALTVDELRQLRLSGSKAAHLLAIAAAVADGSLPLADLGTGTATAAHRRLLAVRGIGPWTAGYVLLRGFGFVDALPVGDAVLAASLQQHLGLAERPDATATAAACARFAPFRGQLTFQLWNAHPAKAPAALVEC